MRRNCNHGRSLIYTTLVYIVVTILLGYTYILHSYNKVVHIDNIETKCNFTNYLLGRASAHQSDPRLIRLFKESFLISPPPQPKLEEGLQNKRITESIQNIVLDTPTVSEKFLWIKQLIVENPTRKSNSKPGFFIDCGANDGSFISTTRYLENYYNWTGLLIGANPVPFEKLLKLRRNVYAVNTALCVTEYPKEVKFYTNPVESGVSGLNKRDDKGANVEIIVQCIPLYTMLAALKLEVVDYLSLDVEGSELEILKTIPFDKVMFKVMTIEHWNIPEGAKGLWEFSEGKGYRFVKIMEDIVTKDSLFVHQSLYERAMTIKV